MKIFSSKRRFLCHYFQFKLNILYFMRLTTKLAVVRELTVVRENASYHHLFLNDSLAGDIKGTRNENDAAWHQRAKHSIILSQTVDVPLSRLFLCRCVLSLNVERLWCYWDRQGINIAHSELSIMLVDLFATEWELGYQNSWDKRAANWWRPCKTRSSDYLTELNWFLLAILLLSVFC